MIRLAAPVMGAVSCRSVPVEVAPSHELAQSGSEVVGPYMVGLSVFLWVGLIVALCQTFGPGWFRRVGEFFSPENHKKQGQ